jgi:predicted small metal-binding protein
VRVIECHLCGQTLSAATDEELVETASRHMDQRHPESEVDETQVRVLVNEQAYDASDS